MTVLSTLSTLQTIVAASSGITTALTSVPSKLDLGQLPCAVIFPDRGTLNEAAVGLHRRIQTYVIRVYVKPIPLDAKIDNGYQACFAPFDALGNTLIQNLSLNNTVDEVRQPIRCVGPRGDYVWGDVTYHGFEYSLDVTEKTTT